MDWGNLHLFLIVSKEKRTNECKDFLVDYGIVKKDQHREQQGGFT